LTSGYDRRRRTWIADTNKLATRLKQIIAQRGNFVIDGHYAAEMIPESQVTKVFVLRRHPERLKKQLEKRGFEGAKLWENLAAEVLDVCLHDAVMNAGVDKVCEVDTTDKRSQETVDEIMSILDGKVACCTGTTDWLEKLEQERKLDQYLKHF
jgi:adenylate kinase